MMPYYFYNNTMAGWGMIVAFIFWLVILIDLILLGIWLWQRIGRK